MIPTERMEKLQRLLDDDPSDSFARYALALEFLGRKDVERAMELLRETIERDPAYVPAYQMLGHQCLQRGADDEARSVLERGIAVARSSGEMHAATEMQDDLDMLD